MCLTSITSNRYLVSVYRARTGNVHRAVGPDFVLSVGDTLYFTGMVKAFGKFCAEHGLEMVTSENDDQANATEEELYPTQTVESGPNWMIIDVDNVDFVNNPEDLGMIINRIDAEINGLF